MANAEFCLELDVFVDGPSIPELQQTLQWPGREAQSFSLDQLCQKIHFFLQDTAAEMFSDQNLADTLRRELGREFGHNWRASLLLCSDQRIAEWNRKFCGQDGPTDILSFCLNSADPTESADPVNFEDAPSGGDLLLSLPRWLANCREFACSPEEELHRLLIHGLLHLAGLDHGEENLSEPQSSMLQYQESLLKRSRQRRRILPQ